MLIKYLLLLRNLRRFRRRVFGGQTPRWVRDLMGLVKYINFLALLPTVLYMTLAPEHFFRRLPIVVAGKSKIHKSPVAFFTSTVALEVVVSKLFAARIPEDLLGQMELTRGDLELGSGASQLLWTVISLPIAIPLVAAVGLILAVILRAVPAINTLPFAQRNHYIFLVPLDPRTYMQLRPMRYLWSLLYFEALWLMAAPLLSACFALSVLAFLNIFSVRAVLFGNEWLRWPKIFLLVASFIPLVVVVEKLLAFPYAIALRESMRADTPFSMRLATAIGAATPKAKPTGAKNTHDEAWPCPKCNVHNPNSKLQCQQCGYSLT